MSAELKTIGVVGAGQMGAGIAHVCVLAGYTVLLNDISPARIDEGVRAMSKNMDRQIAKATITAAQKDQALARLKPAPALAALKDADLVLEAVSEKEALKTQIFKELAAVMRADALLASNTSSISITRLAAAAGRPERFIGVHFMNPVPLMPLIEIIRGIATSDATFETIRAFCARLGKQTAVAEDYPGFIVNRVLMPMINEAVYALYEGVGTIESIDRAMRLGANHPMGPLQLADFIGLDTCLSIMQVLHDGLSDTKYRPCPLLAKYVEAGWLGRKTGRGFYDYAGEKPVPTR